MFIATPRLLLRPLWAEDQRFVMAQDFTPDVRALAGLALGPRAASCLIEARTTGAPMPVGLGGFAPKAAGVDSAACLWLQLASSAQGRGYGREALDGLLEMAFAGLRYGRVEAHASAETSWAALLSAAGFRTQSAGGSLWGLAREEWRKDATWFRAAA